VFTLRVAADIVWARALEYCNVEIYAATTPIHRVASTAREKDFAGPVHRRREHKPLYAISA